MTTSDTTDTTAISTISCLICGESKWANVDEYRLKPDGMCMCEKCGFVTYPAIIAKSEELKEYYRKEYRPGPSVANVFTGQRKLHYHANFLNDLLLEWKKKHIKPVVFEVGAAFGMFLKWISDNVKDAKVYGSELTLSFRRVAFHEYNIPLAEEFDDTKKYDLIASYKVAEHMAHADKEIRRYAEALKSDGHVYISVPIWFESMSNFGADGFTLDYYYDKNHVNVWTRKNFETLLKKCGLEIVKEDHVYYDSTYLCKRNDEMMKVEPVYDEPTRILDCLSRIKKSSIAFDSGKFSEAVSIFATYPDAHIGSYEHARKQWHEKGFEAIEKEVMAPALAACPNSQKITYFCADLCMRYEQLDKALEYLNKCIVQKPGCASSLNALAHCYRGMAQKTKDKAQKEQLLIQARDIGRHVNQISLQHSTESISWIFADEAKIPMPGETGEACVTPDEKP